MNQELNEEALLPCPCCKGRAQVIEGEATEQVWKHGTFWWVFCTVCQLRQLFYRAKKAAIKAWNTRAGQFQQTTPLCINSEQQIEQIADEYVKKNSYQFDCSNGEAFGIFIDGFKAAYQQSIQAGGDVVEPQYMYVEGNLDHTKLEKVAGYIRSSIAAFAEHTNKMGGKQFNQTYLDAMIMKHAQAIMELSAINGQEWLPASQAPYNEMCLFYTVDGNIVQGFIYDGDEKDFGYTHYMPLPQPPISQLTKGEK